MCDGVDVSQIVSLLDRVVLSVPEAARQLRIPQSTLRHWLEGHTVRGKWYEPVLRPTPEGHNQVTWGEMVEASYLRRYREHRVPMQQLRPFIERAREVFDTRYPLAHRAPFVGGGRKLLLEVQNAVNLNPDLRAVIELKSGQLELDYRAHSYIEHVEFGDLVDEVYRLRPDGRKSPVVNDPRLSAGSATVRGIRTEILAEQATAGASIREIAEDFGLSVGEVSAALHHEFAQTA